jgi:hypothetical protein
MGSEDGLLGDLLHTEGRVLGLEVPEYRFVQRVDELHELEGDQRQRVAVLFVAFPAPDVEELLLASGIVGQQSVQQWDQWGPMRGLPVMKRTLSVLVAPLESEGGLTLGQISRIFQGILTPF